MTDDELKAIEARANAALEDTSFVLRVNLWLTAGDGRQFCASAITDIPLLIAALRAAREALRFYADANYQLDVSQETQEQFRNRIYNDRGHRARKALGEE